MKKILTLVLAAFTLMSLCACVSQEDFDAEVSRHQEEISRLETQLQTLQDQNARQEEANRSLMEQNTELENKLNEYSWVIGALENENYGYITSRVNEIQREKELAEMEAKGVLEIEITLDNWDQYFEYIPYGYSYIKNSFGETTHFNIIGGIKLKDAYTVAEGYNSEVAFELTTQREKRSCTANFDTLEITFGEVTSTREASESSRTTTFRYDGYSMLTYGAGNVAIFGAIAQLNNSKGQEVTQDVEIEAITGMIRVKGTLRIYGN